MPPKQEIIPGIPHRTRKIIVIIRLDVFFIFSSLDGINTRSRRARRGFVMLANLPGTYQPFHGNCQLGGYLAKKVGGW